MPLYGLDNNIIAPPFSAIIGLLLIAGCDFVGLFILRRFSFQCDSLKQWARWQAPIIGAMVLAITLYPLALANLTPRSLMLSAAIFWCALGIFHLYNERTHFKMYWADFLALISSPSGKLDGWGAIFLLLLIGYFLLALGAISSHDALAYHAGIAIHLLNTGGMPFEPEWFTSRIGGNGEVLTAFGLALGSEQFAGLLQFMGLVGIIGLILRAESGSETDLGTKNSRMRFFLAFVAIATPVLLSQVSSSKPQLLPVAMTTLALAFLVFPSRRNLSDRDAILNFSLVCALVMAASQAKLTYMLGGGVVGCIGLFLMARRQLLFPALVVGILMAFLIMTPHVIWQMHYYHASLLDGITELMPAHWPGTDRLAILGSSSSGYPSGFPFPLSMIIPSGAKSAAHVLGFGAFLVFILRFWNNRWLCCGAIGIGVVILGAAVLGPPSGRMFLEPYFWTLLMIALSPAIFERMFPWFRWAVLGQSICVVIVLWYGVATLFPTALNPEWRTQIMHRVANGYTVMKWADSVLPKDAVLLNPHRSMTLVPRKAVSMQWLAYAPLDSQVYLERIKESGVTHILVLQNSTKLSGCFGRLVAEGGPDHFASRNPVYHEPYPDAKIYEFKLQEFPACAFVKR